MLTGAPLPGQPWRQASSHGPRADPPERAGQHVGDPVDLVGAAVAVLEDHLDVGRHVGVGRAGGLAGDVLAHPADVARVGRVAHRRDHAAAIGLPPGEVLVLVEVDLADLLPGHLAASFDAPMLDHQPLRTDHARRAAEPGLNAKSRPIEGAWPPDWRACAGTRRYLSCRRALRIAERRPGATRWSASSAGDCARSSAGAARTSTRRPRCAPPGSAAASSASPISTPWSRSTPRAARARSPGFGKYGHLGPDEQVARQDLDHHDWVRHMEDTPWFPGRTLRPAAARGARGRDLRRLGRVRLPRPAPGGGDQLRGLRRRARAALPGRRQRGRLRRRGRAGPADRRRHGPLRPQVEVVLPPEALRVLGQRLRLQEPPAQDRARRPG